MENQESMLVKGFFPKEKNPNSPDFVLGKASFNLPMFAEFMREFKAANPGEEWVNVDMKIARSGKPYASVDTWKPDPDRVAAPQAQAAPPPAADTDLPF